MNKLSTKLQDVFIYEPQIFEDDRGYFSGTFKLNQLGFEINFVQDNQSLSIKPGTIRGMHLQKGSFSQAKLVRVLSGKIIDVIVDLRPESFTYLKHQSFELDSITMKSLFVPRGFAHGFITLEPNTVVMYKVDNVYNKGSEISIKWDDPDLDINWKPFEEYTISEKDQNGMSLKEYLNE